MDDSRPIRAIQHHQLEQVRGPIRAEHQIAERILADLVDSQGVHECVLDVLRVDAVPQRRREHLHLRIVLRNPGRERLDRGVPLAAGGWDTARAQDATGPGAFMEVARGGIEPPTYRFSDHR